MPSEEEIIAAGGKSARMRAYLERAVMSPAAWAGAIFVIVVATLVFGRS